MLNDLNILFVWIIYNHARVLVSVLAVMKPETYLSHEEQIQLMLEEEKRSLEDQNLHVRFFALPEINVATNESYNELRQMKEEVIKYTNTKYIWMYVKVLWQRISRTSLRWMGIYTCCRGWKEIQFVVENIRSGKHLYNVHMQYWWSETPVKQNVSLNTRC